MIDFGIGNLRSVQKALEYVGASVDLSDDPDEVLRARKLILPGVGAFGAGMDALQQRRLVTPIQKAVAEGSPLLGICLGMQLLFDESEELGQHKGLGLIPGRVLRFSDTSLVVPHMGWNQIEHDGSHPLLAGVPDGAHAYFVHSYYCEPEAPDVCVGSTHYGRRFAAVVGHNEIFGLQFHPEKSQHVGLRILENFVNL
jgi:glutamine amidotransferase